MVHFDFICEYLLNENVLINYLHEREITNLFCVNRKLCNIQLLYLDELDGDVFGIINSYSTIKDLCLQQRVNKYLYDQAKLALQRKYAGYIMYKTFDNYLSCSIKLQYSKVLIIIASNDDRIALGDFITNLVKNKYNNIQIIYITTIDLIRKHYPTAKKYDSFLESDSQLKNFISYLNHKFYNHDLMDLSNVEKYKIQILKNHKKTHENESNLRYIILDSPVTCIDDSFYISLYFYAQQLIDFYIFSSENICASAVSAMFLQKMCINCKHLKCINLLGLEHFILSFDKLCDIIYLINTNRCNPIFILRVNIHSFNFKNSFLNRFQIISDIYKLYLIPFYLINIQ